MAGVPARPLPALRLPGLGALLGGQGGSGSGATPRGETPGSAAFGAGFPFGEESSGASLHETSSGAVATRRSVLPLAATFAPPGSVAPSARPGAWRPGCGASREKLAGRVLARKCPVRGGLPHGSPRVWPRHRALPDRASGWSMPARQGPGRRLKRPRNARHSWQRTLSPCGSQGRLRRALSAARVASYSVGRLGGRGGASALGVALLLWLLSDSSVAPFCLPRAEPEPDTGLYTRRPRRRSRHRGACMPPTGRWPARASPRLLDSPSAAFSLSCVHRRTGVAATRRSAQCWASPSGWAAPAVAPPARERHPPSGQCRRDCATPHLHPSRRSPTRPHTRAARCMRPPLGPGTPRRRCRRSWRCSAPELLLPPPPPRAPATSLSRSSR